MGTGNGYAQLKDTAVFAFPIQMDEFVLKASREGWNVDEFINRVKTDTTFYKAFKTLHLVPYISVNDIEVLGRAGKVKASLFSRTKQTISKGCRSMEVLDQETTGDFFDRRGNYNYYTAELYGYLFFTKKPVCGENNIVAGSDEQRGSGQLEKRKWQLKQLVFNPGSKIAGVPFAGNKAAIFEPGISKMYDFKLLAVEYAGEDCYLFSAVPKPEYKDEVIYNELATWFRRSDYSIVARDYALSYKTVLYDFDVKMKVRLGNINGRLLPTRISYAGNWHLATQKRERARFTTVITY
jgi:hypothetical protein